jgi:plastocyanin
MRKIAVYFIVMFALACIPVASSHAATVPVSIVDFAFSPQNITINVGDTVMWTNNGAALHTTTSGSNCTFDGVGWNSELSSGMSFSRTFNTPGTFPYFCSFHCLLFGMVGSVVVNPAIIPAPVGRTSLFFSPVAVPVLGSTNITSMPIGIGALATGGSTLTIAIALGPYAVPVDVYAAFVVSTNPLNVVNIRPDLTFENITFSDVAQTLSTGVVPAGVVPWMSNVSTEINITLFSNVPVSNIAPGQYTAYLLVQPHGGNFSNFDLYTTIFTIP